MPTQRVPRQRLRRGASLLLQASIHACADNMVKNHTHGAIGHNKHGSGGRDPTIDQTPTTDDTLTEPATKRPRLNPDNKYAVLVMCPNEDFEADVSEDDLSAEECIKLSEALGSSSCRLAVLNMGLLGLVLPSGAVTSALREQLAHAPQY